MMFGKMGKIKIARPFEMTRLDRIEYWRKQLKRVINEASSGDLEKTVTLVSERRKVAERLGELAELQAALNLCTIASQLGVNL